MEEDRLQVTPSTLSFRRSTPRSQPICSSSRGKSLRANRSLSPPISGKLELDMIAAAENVLCACRRDGQISITSGAVLNYETHTVQACGPGHR